MPGVGVDAGDAGVRERTEAWFRSRGVPHFIEGYSAARDILTRAVPLLTLIFLVEVLGAANLDWPWWGNLLAVLGGMAILLVAWVGLNALRKRPLLARPDSIGAPEVALFVLVPAVLPLAFGGQVVSAVVTATANLLLLGVIYLGTSYAVFPMLRWAFVRFGRQLGGIIRLLVRALPLLMLFITFLFLQNEVWQTTADLEDPWYWIVLGSIVGLAVLFLGTRLPGELGVLARFDSWEDVTALVDDTPVEPVCSRVTPPVDTPPLRKRQWGNVWLVAMFSQGLQIVLVSLLIGVVMVGFGMVTVSPELIGSWTGAKTDVLASVELFGEELFLTEQMLRVAGFLSAFSALYVSVSAVTDEAYRAEFSDQIAAELRQAFAVRAVYLATVGPRVSSPA
jgi:hypothetical protein